LDSGENDRPFDEAKVILKDIISAFYPSTYYEETSLELVTSKCADEKSISYRRQIMMKNLGIYEKLLILDNP